MPCGAQGSVRSFAATRQNPVEISVDVPQAGRQQTSGCARTPIRSPAIRQLLQRMPSRARKDGEARQGEGVDLDEESMADSGLKFGSRTPGRLMLIIFAVATVVIIILMSTLKITGRCPTDEGTSTTCRVAAYRTHNFLLVVVKLIPFGALVMLWSSIEIAAHMSNAAAAAGDPVKPLRMPADMLVGVLIGIWSVIVGVVIRVGVEPRRHWLYVGFGAVVWPLLGYVTRRVRLRMCRLLSRVEISQLAAYRSWSLRVVLQLLVIFLMLDTVSMLAPGPSYTAHVLLVRGTMDACVHRIGNASGWAFHSAECREVRYTALLSDLTYELMTTVIVMFYVYHYVTVRRLVNVSSVQLLLRLLLFVQYFLFAFNVALVFMPREMVLDGVLADDVQPNVALINSGIAVLFLFVFLYNFIREAAQQLLGAFSKRSQSVDVFISLRIAEAEVEGEALYAALLARGCSVFISTADVHSGGDLMKEISENLEGCLLVVILASQTYGRDTNTSFSTYHEFHYVIDEKKPFVLVKMCDEWEEAHVKLALGKRTLYTQWTPGQALPEALVEEVVGKVETLRSSLARSLRKCRGTVISTTTAIATGTGSLGMSDFTHDISYPQRLSSSQI